MRRSEMRIRFSSFGLRHSFQRFRRCWGMPLAPSPQPDLSLHLLGMLSAFHRRGCNPSDVVLGLPVIEEFLFSNQKIVRITLHQHGKFECLLAVFIPGML